jgi:hypothetical protein
VKRGSIFNCGHEGAARRYVSTFSSVERVTLCTACVAAVNDNLQDPRFIADTVSDAVRGREVKHAPTD